MMKRIIGITLICLMLIVLPVSALDIENNGDTFIIQEDEMVDHDVFAGAGFVKILGQVNGDVFAAGGEFENSGHVKGDIILGAGNSYIGGLVDGDLRIGTGRLVISGEVRRNVTALSSDIVLEKDAVIDGSFTALAGRVVLNGFVGGDFRSGTSESILINGVIKGDVQVGNSRFQFGPEAKIHGSLTYAAESKANIPEGVVLGEVIHKQPTKQVNLEENKEQIEKGFKVFNVVRGALSLLSYLIIGILLTLIFKGFMKKSSLTVEQKPWHSLGIGIVGLIVTPIAAVLVMITVIGIPVGIISLMLYAILVYLAKLPCALWIGSKILRDEEKLLLPILLGVFILSLVSYIPYLGFLVSLVAITFGIGSYFINIKEALQKPKKDIDPLI